MNDAVIRELAEQLGAALKGRGLMLATAESCTGGWLAKAITDVPGSSQWFDRGFVTYSNEAKREQLGVSAQTIEMKGAVSDATAREMAAGALRASHAQVAAAITGVAGPDGGGAEKPVGTVWFACALTGEPGIAWRCLFSGDRESVRRQAVAEALRKLPELLKAQ
ncbi:MAG: nicotinamide-nucleotide amidase [Chromatiales bacterium]